MKTWFWLFGAIAAVALGVLIMLKSCNKQLLDFQLKFTKAYVKWPDGSMQVIEIKKWNDYNNSDQIQVIGKDGKTYLFHSVNVTLVKE